MAAKSSTESRDLKKRLEARGCSYTRQRAAVYDYLSRVSHHPTAEEVFLEVKKVLPKVSLATVYKNLESLIECDAASKLSYGDGPARYDVRTDYHYHTRCLECGQLRDVEAGPATRVLSEISPGTGFEVTDYRLELLGFCQQCAEKRDAGNRSSSA